LASSFSQAVSSDRAGGGAAAVLAVEGAVLATLFWELEEVEVVLVAVPDTAAVVTATVDTDAAAAALDCCCSWLAMVDYEKVNLGWITLDGLRKW